MFYFMTLPVTQTVKYRPIRLLMDDELETLTGTNWRE